MRPQRADYTRSTTSDSIQTIDTRGQAAHVYRFDGINKTNQSWNQLRRDEELWSQAGDCAVHLCAPNTSRRGPSLRVPLKVVEQTESSFLLQECLHKFSPASPSMSDDDTSDSGYSGSASGSLSGCSELYIPAPAYATREEAHLYHLNTRNFFAYLLDVPLVGRTLGEALVQLWDCITRWQPSSAAESDFRVYCKEQGYLSFVENAQYALATLYFVEQTRIVNMWTEAFVHCVGMHDRLDTVEDYARLSEETRESLAQADANMKSHIAQVTNSLGTFLEEELGAENLGLSKPMRDHLDRFRSMLHTFYVHEINGYFPPDKSDPWGKRLWHGMYGDFHSLYLYLADKTSSDIHASNLGAQGGICVAQNLQAFNMRHDFIPLPYTLPLLPDYRPRTQERPPELRRSLGSLRLGRSSSTITTRPTSRQALSEATNGHGQSVTRNRLVREYMRFEGLKMEEKVTTTEARKTRWLLVYSALQLLRSVTRAPAEVQDTEAPSYPLCVLDTDTACPTWPEDEQTWQSSEDHAAQYLAAVQAVRDSMDADRISIHPDCEASCAADYFSMNAVHRPDTSASAETTPTGLTRRNSTLSRTASIRSSVSTLHRSMVGSLVRRNSQRRGSMISPSLKSPTVGTFCETLHELHGTEAEESSPVDSVMGLDSPFEVASPDDSDAPALEMHQLSTVETPTRPIRMLRHTSESSRHKGRKSRTSSISCGSPPSKASPMDLPQRLASDLGAFDFGFNNVPQSSTKPEPQQPAGTPPPSRWAGISAGSYTPTGNFSTRSRVQSTNSLISMASNASSIYPENSMQADDIEEEDVRGRRRLRGLDRLRSFAL